MTGTGLPVLTYHAIAAERSVTAVTPGEFAETLDALDDAGFEAVALDQWVAGGRPDAPGRFGLTFDDGPRSILNVAEIVTARGWPATVFVVPDHVGRDNDWPGQPAFVPRERLLDWSELAALGKLGFRFGAHGATHAQLDRLSPSKLDDELKRSRETIEQRLGTPCPLLAYPYGNNNPAVRLAASNRFSAAFGTRLGYAGAADDPFDLPRIDAFYLKGRRQRDALAGDYWRRGLAWRERLRSVRRGAVGLTSGARP